MARTATNGDEGVGEGVARLGAAAAAVAVRDARTGLARTNAGDARLDEDVELLLLLLLLVGDGG